MPDAIYTGVSESHLGSLPPYGITVPSGAGTTTAFTPASVTGLFAWYDFSTGATTLFTDTARTTPVSADDLIKGVADKSGSSFHLSSATNPPAYKTSIINSLSVARFDATNDTLKTAAFGSGDRAQPYVVMFVGSCSQGAGTTAQFTDGLTAGKRGATYRHGATNKWACFAGSAEIDGGATDTSVHIFQYTFNGATSKIRVGGGAATTGDPGSNALDGITLGSKYDGTSPLGGDIGEIVYYSSALSTTNLDLVGNYLASKWGATWSAAI